MVRALNFSSLHAVNQAVLCEDMMTEPDLVVWEEITMNVYICLHMQHCALRATEKSMGMICP